MNIADMSGVFFALILLNNYQQSVKWIVLLLLYIRHKPRNDLGFRRTAITVNQLQKIYASFPIKIFLLQQHYFLQQIINK